MVVSRGHHPVSVRLDKALEERLRRHVAARGGSLASFVREAVDEKIADMSKRPSARKRGKVRAKDHRRKKDKG